MSDKHAGRKKRARAERLREARARADARRAGPPRGPVRSAGWAVGAVAGVVVGCLAAWGTQQWQVEREDSDVVARAKAFYAEDVPPPPGDAVRALLGQDSLVALDPLVADRVPEADRERAEAILADAAVPSRIAYLADPTTSDTGYTPSGAAAQWSTGVGEDGHYVVLLSSGRSESVAVGLEEHYVETRTEGQPGPALVRLAAEMAAWEPESLPTEPDEPNDFDYWGGTGGGIMAGVLMGGFGVVPAFLLLRWWVGSRRPRQPVQPEQPTQQGVT